jgi:proton-translocating NADH-quinone oxidoreductase chain M
VLVRVQLRVQEKKTLMLISLLIILILGLLGVIFSPNQNLARPIGLASSCFAFVYSLFLWLTFDQSTAKFQFLTDIQWWPLTNWHLPLGVDGISLFFILLTTFLFPLCLLSSWQSVQHKTRAYFSCFLAIEILLILVFTVLDIFWFYVFFEAVLIPMFIVIGLWGSRQRKIRASYLFFIYTLVGSLLMLGCLAYIYSVVGTINYESVLAYSFTFREEKWLWLGFFASFATKVPIVPFHIWLPEAHVEAPTAGSVLLAGVLLKLGTYGFLRFSLPLFPQASEYYTPLVLVMGIVGVIYTSLTAIRQTDLKRIIAYTSVAHMNLVIIGLFSLTVVGLEGSILQSLSHGFVSSALFLVVGVLYDRHHTRILKYYGGLVHVMPVFTLFFVFFTMANIALPGTSSFVGEFLLMAGAFQANPISCFWGATGIILGGGYSLWLLNRVVYGNLKTQYLSGFTDMNRLEICVLFPLAFGTLFIGIYPEVFLENMHVSVSNLLKPF